MATFIFFVQKNSDFSHMEMNALKVAEDINAEYWSVSSKSGNVHVCRRFTSKFSYNR